MAKIILMRHGRTLANIEQIYQGQGDSPLSELGIKQAKAASKFLAHTKIDEIYSSDLTRSFETANIMAKPHKKSVIKIRGLRERFYGKWEGMRFDEIERKYNRLYKKWMITPNKARIPGAEPLKDLQKRGVSAVKAIAKSKKDKTILIVGHGGINRTILFHFLGIDLNDFWKIKQDNCCMNVIEFDKEKIRVSLLNSTCFLSELHARRPDVLA